MTRRIVLALFSCAVALSAADFQDYQAARAVIGQTSFSGHDKGVTAVALSLSKGSLYVADNAGHLLNFDLSRIGAAVTPGCAVCLATPQGSSVQSVFEGIAAVAVNGRNVAIADAKSHRVMLWSGNSPQPAVVLSGFVNPVSVALDNQRMFVGDAGSHHVLIWNQLPLSGSPPPDVTLGVSENFDVPSADSIQNPSALVSDGVNLYVADAGAHRVLVFSAAETAAPEPVNAATLAAGPLAPGTLVSVEHAAAATASIWLNGAALHVTEVSGDQLQFQIPYELNNATSGSLWIQSELDNGAVSSSRAVAVHFAAAAPGLFAFGLTEPRTGLILHAPNGIPLSPENPAKPSELLTAWATGLGAVSSVANRDGSFDVLTPVRATINGVPVEVGSAVLPAEATGVYEVRLRLPADLSGNVSLVLTQNDSKSNAVTFPVQQILP